MKQYRIDNLEGSMLTSIDRPCTIIGYIVKDILEFTGIIFNNKDKKKKGFGVFVKNDNNKEEDITYKGLKNKILLVCELIENEINIYKNYYIRIEEFIGKKLFPIRAGEGIHIIGALDGFLHHVIVFLTAEHHDHVSQADSRSNESDGIKVDHVFDQHLADNAAAHGIPHCADFCNTVGLFGVIDDIQDILAHVRHGIQMIIFRGCAAAGKVKFRDQHTVFGKAFRNGIITAPFIVIAVMAMDQNDD